MTGSRARKTRALPAAQPRGGDPLGSDRHDEADLLRRARSLSGASLEEIARCAGIALPRVPSRAKGFVGGLIERVLGGTAGSSAAPDFPALGIELKTIPLDRQGRPRESTFVCTIALRSMAEAEWETSAVRKKLARVLFVPIETEPDLAFAERRVGAPRLWSPSPDEEAELRADFEELAGRMGRGEVELITGRIGRHLQVRPKAPNSHVTVRGMDERGAPARVPPRAFYLRRTFTARIFAPARDDRHAAQHLL